MKRTIILFALLLVMASFPARSDNWRNGLSHFITAPPTSAQTPSRTRLQGQTLYYAPVAPKRSSHPADIKLDNTSLKIPAFIRGGRTYVGLRAFLTELHDRYHLDFDIEYTGNNQVAIRRTDTGSEDGDFGRGWTALWHGSVATAISAFKRASSTNGSNADDAHNIADWLRPGGGIIRIAWWHLPEDISVFIDGDKITRGELLLRADAGVHALRLVTPEGNEVLNKRFLVKPDEAFIVQFGSTGQK